MVVAYCDHCSFFCRRGTSQLTDQMDDDSILGDVTGIEDWMIANGGCVKVGGEGRAPPVSRFVVVVRCVRVNIPHPAVRITVAASHTCLATSSASILFAQLKLTNLNWDFSSACFFSITLMTSAFDCHRSSHRRPLSPHTHPPRSLPTARRLATNRALEAHPGVSPSHRATATPLFHSFCWLAARARRRRPMTADRRPL